MKNILILVQSCKILDKAEGKFTESMNKIIRKLIVETLKN